MIEQVPGYREELERKHRQAFEHGAVQGDRPGEAAAVFLETILSRSEEGDPREYQDERPQIAPHLPQVRDDQMQETWVPLVIDEKEGRSLRQHYPDREKPERSRARR